MNHDNTPVAGEVFLRLPQVSARLGLGRSAIYNLVKRGQLCPPIKLGVRASAWPSSAIDQFIAERIRASRGLR
jgi:prophage regulatory protein